MDGEVSKAAQQEYRPVVVSTVRGSIEGRYYTRGEESRAVVYVGGVGGDFDTPAGGLYPKLCIDLLFYGISGLRIKYRDPLSLSESVHDVKAGIDYLKALNVSRIGLVGHSMGGAAVIQAAEDEAAVKTVVALSAQSFGAEGAARLSGKPVLLIHGRSDEVLPFYSSQRIYSLTHGEKKLVLLDGAHHVLDEKAGEVYSLVRSWILEHLQ